MEEIERATAPTEAFAGDPLSFVHGQADPLVAEAGVAVMQFQESTDAVDEAAAAYLGLRRSEMRCLSILMRGPRSASELADEMVMTRGAITALVDRLEARQLVVRQPVEGDRRRVSIALTRRGLEEGAEVYGPLGQEGVERLAGYSEDELRVIVRFLREGVELQQRHANRVREMAERRLQEAETPPAAPQSKGGGRRTGRKAAVS